MPKKEIQIVDRKLGRERALGQAYWTLGLIEMDPRLTPRKYLKILVHEALHLADPNLSERHVIKLAAVVGRALWKHGIRRVYL